MQMNQFGRLLRRYREEAGLGFTSLSIRSGYSRRYLNGLEDGHSLPRKDTVADLAKALCLDPEATDMFFFAAGYAPLSYKTEVDPEDPKLSIFSPKLDIFDPKSQPEMWAQIVEFVTFIRYCEEHPERQGELDALIMAH